MSIQLSEIPGAFHLPRRDWGIIRNWVDHHVADSERHSAWTEIAKQWLAVLDQALGGRYQILQTDHLILFAPREFEDVESLLAFAESGCDAIVNALGILAREVWLGPHVVLLFENAESYDDYVTPFGGNYVPSAGMCLREGYVHVAVHPGQLDRVRQTLLHELTHACLSHLSLPLWLEEGVTQLAEEATIPDWGRFRLDTKTAADLREYWRTNGLCHFWWGSGFHADDEAQTHSYRLAEILFRILATDHQRALPEFVRHANHADAGESAARDILGEGLAKLAAQFLGPGPWDPIPHDASTFCGRGCLLLERAQHAAAIADFDSAIALDPRHSDSYAHRGEARYRIGDYAAAIVDYEQAIDLNPKDGDTASLCPGRSPPREWMLSAPLNPDQGIRQTFASPTEVPSSCPQ